MKQIVTIVTYSLRKGENHMEVSKSITTSMIVVSIYSIMNKYGPKYVTACMNQENNMLKEFGVSTFKGKIRLVSY